MRLSTNIIFFIIGILVSAVMLYFALVDVDYHRFVVEIRDAKLQYVITAVLIMFAGHWLRSVRWKMLLSPYKDIAGSKLFSALMVGYLGNTVLPAHLGELIRSYIIKRNSALSGSLVLGTITLERFLDIISLLIIMSVVFIVYPFPAWLQSSVLIMMLVVIGLFALAVVIRKNSQDVHNFISKMIGFFSMRAAEKFTLKMNNFSDGLLSIKKVSSRLKLIVLTLLIWISYWLFLHINLYSLEVVTIYKLTPIASLILLVATTVSIIVPSSPGYIGTYHYLCVISLMLFDVPKETALSYAILAHASNILPLLVAGLIFSWKEGIKIFHHRDYEHTADPIRKNGR